MSTPILIFLAAFLVGAIAPARWLPDVGLAGEKPDVVANGITTTLSQIGPVLGIAAAVYLLAPAPDEEQIAVASHAAPSLYSNNG